MSVAAPDPEDLRRLARLAGLEINEGDLPETVRSIERILAFMAGMTGIEDAGQDARRGFDGPGHHRTPDTEGSEPPTRIDVTEFAPQVEDGLILCPPVPREEYPPA